MQQFTLVCKTCKKQAKRYVGTGIDDDMCYSCEDDWMEQEGLWIDPAGGIHSKEEKDPSRMYK